MTKLSETMKRVGWIIEPRKDGSWTVHASGARDYVFQLGFGWSVPLEEIEAALDADVKALEAGELDPSRTLSRVTALNHTRNPSQPVVRICKDGLVAGKRILHLGTGLDRFARKTLLGAGAVLVNDYDPNFFPDRSVLEETYDVVVCNYVLNILPPAERKRVYADIATCTGASGRAYLCVQGKWPVQNRHRIVGTFADGYVIQDGPTFHFRKGYDPEEFLAEIRSSMDGTARVMCMFYSNTLAEWTPQAQVSRNNAP
ncbi:methyltransferase domain-containing protein [Desulfoplanes sp.]